MDKPVVLITGALSGIGRATAIAFAKNGATVVVSGRHDEAGKALAEELRSFGSEAEFINADVRKEEDVRALMDRTIEQFGRLDVAVNNAAGAAVYVGSKHAVEGITKSVALEVVRSGLRVNAVAPGATDTDMLTRFTGTPENKAALVGGVPMDRLGLAEEIANGIVFIASDEASFITGHILNIDGGLTIH